MRTLHCAVFTLVALASAAKADAVIPPCWPESQNVAGVTLSKAPEGLRRALAIGIGWMAKPGEDFNATDVVDPRFPSNRLIFIWHYADIWIVATEHGGSIAYNDPVLLYRITGSKTAMIETRRAVPNTVCATANALAARHRK